jgi:hypothetical protein
MTPTAHGDKNITLPGESNAKDDVGGTRAARDERRTTVYPCVMNGAGSIVAGLAQGRRIDL